MGQWDSHVSYSLIVLRQFHCLRVPWSLRVFVVKKRQWRIIIQKWYNFRISLSDTPKSIKSALVLS